MEFDSHLLLDILKFLQTLKNVALPAMFETSRDSLLGRVQIALSPGDNYIDMKPGKQLQKPPVASQTVIEEIASSSTTSSFLYNHRGKTFSEKPQKQQSPSKSPQPQPKNGPLLHKCIPSSLFLPSALESTVAATVVDSHFEEVTVRRRTRKQEEMEEVLLEVYVTMSFTQVKNKCQKFGELQRRKKRRIFDKFCPSWAVIIGSHFLSYDCNTDTKPSLVFSLIGSSCRPANQMPRSVKKFADSAFDICLEDCRVFQFIASTPKEMEEWMVAIQRTNSTVSMQQQPVSKNPLLVTNSKSSGKVRLNSRREYDNIPDIVDALCDFGEQPATPKAKIIPEAQKTPPGIQTLPSKSPVRVPIRIFRDLPPPPVTTEPDDEANGIYNEIENPLGNRGVGKSERRSAIPFEEEEEEEIEEEKELAQGDDENYDDVDNLRQQAKEMLVHSCVGDDQEVYDDIMDVKHKARIFREAEEAKAEVSEKEKRTLKTPPKLPTRVATAQDKPAQNGVSDEQETYDDVAELKSEEAKAKAEVSEKEERTLKTPPKLPARVATAQDKPAQNGMSDKEETYDDVAGLKSDMQILREAEAAAKVKAKPKAEACEKNKRILKVPPKVPVRGGTAEENPAHKGSIIDEQETYDDVEDVKNDVLILRKTEAAAKAKAKAEVCEKEKRTVKVPPKPPTRVSPMKCLFDKIRNRNESPQKEAEKEEMKPAADLAAPRSNEDVKEPSESYPSNQLLDQSNYNTPRTPRPVHSGNRLGEGMGEEDEEIYDDVLQGTNLGNRMIGRGGESEKLKQNDILLTKYTTIHDQANDGASQGSKKAVKNLSKSFESEIYENQPSNRSVRGNLEFHKTQKLAIEMKNDDEGEEIYDDVQLVAQKNRAIEESKRNLALQSPPRNNRVLDAAKNLFSEKKIKVEKVMHPDNNLQDDNDIYDDCAPK